MKQEVRGVVGNIHEEKVPEASQPDFKLEFGVTFGFDMILERR
jgi:hypothetical protein